MNELNLQSSSIGVMTEEWRPVYIKIVRIPDYYVSNHGRLSKKGKILKTYASPKIKNGRGAAVGVNIRFPTHMIIDGYEHRISSNKRVKYCTMHQLVMWAFKPFDENVPDCLKECWDSTPEAAKEWIRDTVYIDHVDDNPYNNHLSNLRYCKPKENNVERKRNTFVQDNIVNDEIEMKLYNVLF